MRGVSARTALTQASTSATVRGSANSTFWMPGADRADRQVRARLLLDLHHRRHVREQIDGAAQVFQGVQIVRRVLAEELDVVVQKGDPIAIDYSAGARKGPCPRRHEWRDRGHRLPVRHHADQGRPAVSHRPRRRRPDARARLRGGALRCAHPPTFQRSPPERISAPRTATGRADRTPRRRPPCGRA